VLLAGNTTVQYQVSNTGATAINGIGGTALFGTSQGPAALRQVATAAGAGSLFQADYAAMVTRSIGAQGTLNTALAGVTTVTAPTQMTNPVSGVLVNNPLALQLQVIAKIIAAAPTLGTKRQVFFVSIGGFDTHANQNVSQPTLMTQLDHGLGYFQDTLQALNLASNVTTFTMSDFGRTFTTNGLGTDHAWGAHHLVLGGAVRGGDFYNPFPTVGVDLPSSGFLNPDAVGSGALIPTVSVDQYAGTLGAWFGVTASNLGLIFPNLKNFTAANLGFI